MLTRQAFKFDRIDEKKGAWVTSGYVLMSSEVAEFHRLMGEGIKFTYAQAFERLTGKDMRELRNVSLVVEYLPPLENNS